MIVHGFDAARATRRWTVWLSTSALAWGMVAWLIVPPVIRSAYSDGVFGFLGVLMSGRGQLPVERYLEPWYDLALVGLIALVVVYLAGAIVLQPATWRFLRSAWIRVPTFGGRVERRTAALVAALVGITVAMHAGLGVEDWQDAQGHEYESIAQSILAGEGFDFPPGHRWLYLDDEPGQQEHGATAWKEPLYPYFIAGWFKALGPRLGRIAIVLCQVGFLFATCLLIYRLGDHLFGPTVGMLAALGTALMVDLHWIASISIQVPAISGLLLVTALLLLFRYVDSPTLRFAAGIGLFLALATLTHAVLILLVPIAMLFVFLHGRDGTWIERARPAVLVGLTAALAIMPWTIRNYVQFGHLIPVQTGFGLFANVTTPYLGETYTSGFEACDDGSAAAFDAQGPLDALLTLRDGDKFYHTWRRGLRCVAQRHADVYTTLNEHERDGLHREQLFRFVREQPLQFIELVGAKALTYLLDIPVNGRGSIPLAAFGLAGAAMVTRRPRMWVFSAVIVAYSIPFILTAPIYYRYRAPLTPLLTLLAVVLLWRIFEGIRTSIRSASSKIARTSLRSCSRVRFRSNAAFPFTRRPSSATRPSSTSPASRHSPSPSSNSRSSASPCSRRKAAIVRKSGRWFAAR